MDKKLAEILSQFVLDGNVVSCEQFGNGHINWTYRVDTDHGACYVLQRISTYVFRDPVGLMRNVELLTNFMRKKTNDPRKVMQLIPTYDGKTYIVTDDEEYWRVYDFVGNSVCFDQAPSLELFRKTGRAFGDFQNMLADFPVDQLIETIPNFHNTVSRYEDFDAAVAKDEKHRAAGCRAEIDAYLAEKSFAPFLLDKARRGEIPLRVTHNDTKINNVLFDKDTLEPLCVVDLDTTMPGFAAIDFGDGIRYAGNNGAEDEKDLEKVFLRMDLFRSYAEGFCGVSRENLTREELVLCPEAAKLITIETGLRFLTDYLKGDVYFQIAYPEHNLVRARTQLKLAQDMDKNMDAMRKVIEEILQ